MILYTTPQPERAHERVGGPARFGPFVPIQPRTMTIDAIRDHCLGKAGVSEGFPFGEQVLVFKVGSKMFALLNLMDLPTTMNLKCDPERSVELRERYEAVRPGHHMNKTHWNTLFIDGTIPLGEVRALIDHSYDLVAGSLPRAERRLIFGA